MAATPEQLTLDAVLRALNDADAAIDRHIRSRLESDDEARRAIDSALGAIYRAHNYLSVSVPEYWSLADATLIGLKLQAVVYVRGRMEHAPIEPRESELLVPAEDLYPTPDLYPTLNYSWKIWPEMEADMEPPSSRHDKRPLVQFYLAGRLIVGTLRASVEHLRSVAATLT